MLCNFLVWTLNHLKKKKKKIGNENIRKVTSKTYLWQFDFFFSAASIAQNSPELNIRFIDSFIQGFLVLYLGSALFSQLFGIFLKKKTHHMSIVHQLNGRHISGKSCKVKIGHIVPCCIYFGIPFAFRMKCMHM